MTFYSWRLRRYLYCILIIVHAFHIQTELSFNTTYKYIYVYIYVSDRCDIRGGEGPRHHASHRPNGFNPRNFNDAHHIHYINNHTAGQPTQLQPQSHYRIYQGPQSLRTAHVPLQTSKHHTINDISNDNINDKDKSAPTPSTTPPKQEEERASASNGSLTPPSQTSIPTPPLILRPPVDVANMHAMQHVGVNQSLPTLVPHPHHFLPPQFHAYPSHAEHHNQPPMGPQVVPANQNPMRQLNLVWQGLPPNAQIDPDQMFILSGILFVIFFG